MNKEKFKKYWESIGRPTVEFENRSNGAWMVTSKPDWTAAKYRIKGDHNWELRQKWIESDFTLPIEMLNAKGEWKKIQQSPFWFDHIQYREAVGSNKVTRNNESHAAILKHFLGNEEIEIYLLAKAILFYFEHHPEDKGLLDL